MNAFLRAWTAFGFEDLITCSFYTEHNDAEILQELKDFFFEIDEINTKKRENCL